MIKWKIKKRAVPSISKVPNPVHMSEKKTPCFQNISPMPRRISGMPTAVW